MATINLPDDMPDDVKELFGQSIIDVLPSYQYEGDAGGYNPAFTSYTAVINNPNGGVTRYHYDPTQGLLNTGSFGSYGELMQDAQDDDIFTKFGDFALKAAPVVFAGANLYNLANGFGGLSGGDLLDAATAAGADASAASGLTQLGGPGLESVVVSTPADLAGADLIGADLAAETGADLIGADLAAETGAVSQAAGLDSLPIQQFPGADIPTPNVDLGGMTSGNPFQQLPEGGFGNAVSAPTYGAPPTAPGSAFGTITPGNLANSGLVNVTTAEGVIQVPATLNQTIGYTTGALDAAGAATGELIPGVNALYDFGAGALAPAVVDASGKLVLASSLAAPAAGLSLKDLAKYAKKSGGDKNTGAGAGAGNTTIVNKAGGNDSLLAAIMAMAAKAPNAGGDGGVAAAEAARQAAQALTRG